MSSTKSSRSPTLPRPSPRRFDTKSSKRLRRLRPRIPRTRRNRFVEPRLHFSLRLLEPGYHTLSQNWSWSSRRVGAYCSLPLPSRLPLRNHRKRLGSVRYRGSWMTTEDETMKRIEMTKAPSVRLMKASWRNLKISSRKRSASLAYRFSS